MNKDANEQEMVKKKKEKTTRIEKTKNGVEIVNLLTKIFIKPSYFYLTLMDVKKKTTANTYVNSLLKTKKHKMIKKYIELLEMILNKDEVAMDNIRKIVYLARLSAKLDDNRGLKKRFLSRKISIQEIEKIF